MGLQRWGRSPSNIAIPFADLPNPADVPGQIRTISDVGPAPGIELVSDGSRWRPRGGRQVLAMRMMNPVTVQNAVDLVTTDTAGPFPGGLVRAGMRVAFEFSVDHSGFGGARDLNLWLAGVLFKGWNTAADGDGLKSRERYFTDVLADGPYSGYRHTVSATTYGNGSGSSLQSYDFSADWTAEIRLRSTNEDPINIASASWAGGVATFTAVGHTLAVGDKTVVAGVDPAGLNGTYIVDTVPDANTFTVALAADPGAYVSGGTSSRVSNMISESYVLELIG